MGLAAARRSGSRRNPSRVCTSRDGPVNGTLLLPHSQSANCFTVSSQAVRCVVKAWNATVPQGQPRSMAALDNCCGLHAGARLPDVEVLALAVRQWQAGGSLVRFSAPEAHVASNPIGCGTPGPNRCIPMSNMASHLSAQAGGAQEPPQVPLRRAHPLPALSAHIR